jgi:hypothetical protein
MMGWWGTHSPFPVQVRSLVDGHSSSTGQSLEQQFVVLMPLLHVSLTCGAKVHKQTTSKRQANSVVNFERKLRLGSDLGKRMPMTLILPIPTEKDISQA